MNSFHYQIASTQKQDTKTSNFSTKPLVDFNYENLKSKKFINNFSKKLKFTSFFF